MGQITGAIIGITLVLTAVFIPMAFFSGSVGNIYRQFSLSLMRRWVLGAAGADADAGAVRHLLKPVEAGHHHEKKGFFGWFNRTFTTASSYQGMVARISSARAAT
jgi:multidrug efflux pump